MNEDYPKEGVILDCEGRMLAAGIVDKRSLMIGFQVVKKVDSTIRPLRWSLALSLSRLGTKQLCVVLAWKGGCVWLSHLQERPSQVLTSADAPPSVFYTGR